MKVLLPLGAISMVSLDTILSFSDVVFISPYCFDSFMLVPINCLQLLHERIEDMVNEKWLDDKGASREGFQGLSRD